MSGQPSIADVAVSTLAAIQRMDEGIGVETPERHAIREMKRAAENIVMDAFRSAMSLTWAAKTVREVVSDVAKPPESP